jgi:hypothetical protein
MSRKIEKNLYQNEAFQMFLNFRIPQATFYEVRVGRSEDPYILCL